MYFIISGDDRDDARLRKSVCAGYTAELMNMVVHHSDNVEFLKKHGEELLALGESGRISINIMSFVKFIQVSVKLPILMPPL